MDFEWRGSQENQEGTKMDKAKKVVPVVIVCVIVAYVIFRCVFSVNEQTNAVITQFGRVVDVKTAGVYFIPPWQSVKKVDVTTHGTSIGYVIEEDGQKGAYPVDENNAIMITSDFNLLNIDFYIEYKVSDPIAYLYNAEEPDEILKNITMASIRNVVSNYTVDEAMTTGKNQIQSDIKADIVRSLDEQKIGLSLVNITIQDSRPPVDSVVSAFKAVETAKQGADTAMNQALQYKNQQIPAAEADADAIIQKANAYKATRLAEAEGQVARFNEMYKEYSRFPEVTRKRLFFEKMEELMPNVKVIITDGSTQTMLPLDDFASSSDTQAVTATENTSSGNDNTEEEVTEDEE